jgi:hypothetical protein
LANEKNNIALWKSTFSVENWKNETKVKELLSLISSMEGIIAKYLDKIVVDFPNLTDHSIIHSRILWEYADTIIGKKEKYLNPLEGFILNSVFLLHDSGMCYSILNNIDEIKKDVLYTDYIAGNSNYDSEELREKDALFYTVRQNHGEYALRIALELLNEEEFFIPDVNYRQEFGEIIGKIAKSHTLNINYLEREFGSFYSSPKFPTEWTIDYKKLAFILRTADAANLDNLRTPKTLKMIAEIKGESFEHWTFQKKLGMPILDSEGYLIYSTNSPFKKNEQRSWWYCYSALKVLDTELKLANAYFVSGKLNGFDAKNVKYIDDSLALGANSVKTIGWDAIDTTIKVSNPVHIASELGGEKLYGDKKVAIREIIQNGIDAIHLHRMYTGQDNLAVGTIKVTIEQNNEDYYLVIKDNGIGMSQNLLTNELLDFGGSYWKSNKFTTDFKGMKSKGFEAIGKFGIGFFSIFMLGQKVSVTSWRYGDSIKSMRTLDFYDGLNANPILREPNNEERNSIIDRGTSITIKLIDDPYKKGGILYHSSNCYSLSALVQTFIPSADIEIVVNEPNKIEKRILPNSLYDLNCLELLNYLNVKLIEQRRLFDTNDDLIKDLELITIEQDGVLMGRLSILPKTEEITFQTFGVILSKGIKVGEIKNFIGFILSDEVITIRRDTVFSPLRYDTLKDWAIKQISYLNRNNIAKLYEKRINDLTITFGLQDDNFPIVRTKKRGVYKDISIRDFRTYLKKHDTLEFYQENRIEKIRQKNCVGFTNIYIGEDFDGIINIEEADKLNNSDKTIRAMMIEEWGGYEEEDTGHKLFHFASEDPFPVVWKFNKAKDQ